MHRNQTPLPHAEDTNSDIRVMGGQEEDLPAPNPTHRETWPLNVWLSLLPCPISSTYVLENTCLVQTGFKSSPAMYWFCPQASYMTSLSLSVFICKGTMMPTQRTTEGLNETMHTWWIEFYKYGHNGISHPTYSMRTSPNPIKRWCLIPLSFNLDGLVTNRTWWKWCSLTFEAKS